MDNIAPLQTICDLNSKTQIKNIQQMFRYHYTKGSHLPTGRNRSLDCEDFLIVFCKSVKAIETMLIWKILWNDNSLQ